MGGLQLVLVIQILQYCVVAITRLRVMAPPRKICLHAAFSAYWLPLPCISFIDFVRIKLKKLEILIFCLIKESFERMV